MVAANSTLDDLRRADTRPLGRFALPRENPRARADLDSLLESYLTEEDSGYRRSVDTPVPLEPASSADTRRDFWSFQRAFAHQAKLGRTIPVPSKLRR